MFKSTLAFLLIALSSIACLGQIPDSVKIDNEWRYVYPIQESIRFHTDYYHGLGLKPNEFPLWMEWKLANDPRANLKSKKLRRAIYAERFKRLEVRDSIPSKRDLTFHKSRHDFASEYSNEDGINYSVDPDDLENVPPVSRKLPSGKYVLFYKPYTTAGKRSKCQVVQNQIAGKFELRNDELHSWYTRFGLKGDTLMNGIYNKGLKTGIWIEVNDQFSDPPFSYFSVSNYDSGVKDGMSLVYYKGNLNLITNYKNGELTGRVTELTPLDSTVYDAFYAVDVRIDYGELAHLRNDRWITGCEEKIKKKFLPAAFPDLYLISPNLLRAAYPVKYKPIKDSVLSHNLLIGNDEMTPILVFDTYYKKYDRITKKLIYTCFLDTLTRKFTGASWFSNGRKFDTIWTDNNLKIHRIVYDLNGKELQSTLNIEMPIEQFINGYPVRTSFKNGGKEIDHYDLSKMTTRNDTIFTEMKWDQSKKITSAEFHVNDESVRQKITYNDKGYVLTKKGENIDVTIYRNKELELTLSEMDDLSAVSIKLNDQLYEGPIEISKKIKKEFGYWTIQLTQQNRKYTFQSRKISLRSMNPIKDFSFFPSIEFGLLGFYIADGNSCKSITGTIKGNKLDGKVIIKDEFNKYSELTYQNGLPNGFLEVWKAQSKVGQRIFLENAETDSIWIFSMKDLKKKFVFKSMYLENGLLNGPAVYYSSNGDTLGVIPFNKGLKEGKFFYYTENKHGSIKIEKGEFHNDLPVGELLIKERGAYGFLFDTVLLVSFDSNGKFLGGIEKEYDRAFGFVTGEIKFRIGLDNSLHYKKNKKDKIIESGELVNGQFLSKDDYVNGILNTTRIYNDSIFPLFRSYYSSIIGETYSKESDIGNVHFYSPKKELVLNRKPDEGYEFGEFTVSTTRNTAFSSFNHYFKKCFPNGKVSREGMFLTSNPYSYIYNKAGLWKVYDYEGHKQYELNYFDSVVKLGYQEWNIVGTQTDFDTLGNETGKRYVLFEDETYQCSSDDYYTERQFLTITSSDTNKINGWTKNRYDNGTLMNEGQMKNGLPEGLWKFYTPDGKLNRLGRYVEGKQNGKWLIGDLGEKAYIGEVCIDPDDPYYEFNVHSLENDKEIEVISYKKGVVLKRTNYGGNEDIRSDIQLR